MTSPSATAPPTVDGSRLKILLFCYEYPPLGGGGGVGARSYAEAWAAKGHLVRVVTEGRRDLPARDVVNGVELVRASHAASKDRATHNTVAMLMYLVFGSLYVLANRLDLRKFDVINTHFVLPTGPLGWLAARVLSLPQVLTIIGGDIYDPSKRGSPHLHWYWRALNRWLIGSAERVIAISTDTKRRAIELYGIRTSITVSNYGFLPPLESGPGPERRENVFQLVAIGRLVERKGFQFLIRAMPLLPPEIRLWIIGDGPLAESLNALAKSLGVGDRVSLLGYLPPPDILAHLRSADCFVLSSLHEGLGIVVQEAMYSGLPVVATDNGGQVDLIKHGRNGLLVAVADSHALADAIGRLASDMQLARTMGEHNRHDIEAFLMSHKCEEYLAVFRSVLDSRHEALLADS
jgi:glycosyltransferase involved in cell wall biosynthesis